MSGRRGVGGVAGRPGTVSGRRGEAPRHGVGRPAGGARQSSAGSRAVGRTQRRGSGRSRSQTAEGIRSHDAGRRDDMKHRVAV